MRWGTEDDGTRDRAGPGAPLDSAPSPVGARMGDAGTGSERIAAGLGGVVGAPGLARCSLLGPARLGRGARGACRGGILRLGGASPAVADPGGGATGGAGRLALRNI